MIQPVQQWLSTDKRIHLHGWMAQLVFSVPWNPEEVGANEGIDLLLRVIANRGRESKSPPSMSFTNCQQNVWLRLKVDLPSSEI